MGSQMVFKRYEIKFLLSHQQKKRVLEAMAAYMKLDNYGRSTIRNIYYDTENFRLIRRSIEKPVYKEKLRLRSYCQVGGEDDVFVELKKKYRGVVYKRRLTVPRDQAMECLRSHSKLPGRSQISKEIECFCNYYGTLTPAVFLSYEREAYYSLDGSDFRVTFDENVLYRTERLSLSEMPGGKPLLGEGMTLMEIKTPGAIPLWIAHCLTENKIYKTPFSKYGAAYKDMMDQNLKGVHTNVVQPVSRIV